MMTENIHMVYFLGIGGIGMSSLGRYFIRKGIAVAGYDRIATPLTAILESEGMNIHYNDDISLIPEGFKDPEKTLVVYTPAIPDENKELTYFRNNDFRVIKRSVVLGDIVNKGKGIAVAGTHGKTTISGMIAHMLHETGFGCNAFLGGISVNYETNLIVNQGSDLFVVEADEFDRSFLSLYPHTALITSVDEDHLDIYGNRQNLVNAFSMFASRVNKEGTLIIKKGVEIAEPEGPRILRYALNAPADYYAYNIERNNFTYVFSLHTPSGDFHNVETGILGRINIENAVAAFAVSVEIGADAHELIKAIKTYKGIRRRFEIIINNEKMIYIDDYAHHPEELKAFISSVKDAFPRKRITGVFQPHLYSRTRDFADGFAESLSMLDDVILLDIYPARENPIHGVNSEIIFKRLTNKGLRILCNKEELIERVLTAKPELLLTMGAGDIDQMTNPLKRALESIIK